MKSGSLSEQELIRAEQQSGCHRALAFLAVAVGYSLAKRGDAAAGLLQGPRNLAMAVAICSEAQQSD